MTNPADNLALVHCESLDAALDRVLPLESPEFAGVCGDCLLAFCAVAADALSAAAPEGVEADAHSLSVGIGLGVAVGVVAARNPVHPPGTMN